MVVKLGINLEKAGAGMAPEKAQYRTETGHLLPKDFSVLRAPQEEVRN